MSPGLLPLRAEEGELPAAAATNGSAKATVNGNGISAHPNGLKPSLHISDRAIDEYRPMKVVCIGAGYSGIIAGIRFSQRVPNVELTIYEKQGGIGGAWWANRYPGLACDVPAHCYQLTFENNTQWSAFYAPGPEILTEMQRIVEKYKLMRYIQLNTELLHARWDEPSAKWHLRLRRPQSVDSEATDEFEDTADVLFMGVGALSRPVWPDIPGLTSFEGTRVHSAMWGVPGQTWQDSVKDWGDKTVGVIGLGSSAVQIVPALQPKVKHVVQFARGKTWIAAPLAIDKMIELTSHEPEWGNHVFSDEERAAFAKDPEYYRKFRHDIESDLNSVYGVSYRGSEMQKQAAALFEDVMRQKLARKPWIADHLIPNFAVSCRRLTPGPGYLEALCEDNVTFEPTPIREITPTGITLTSGQHTPLDVLICATGFDTSFLFPFPILGRGGMPLTQRWAKHAEAYLSVAVDGFPNMFFGLGPNSGLNSGSLLALLEREVDYAVAATLKLQRERLRSIEVKKAAAADWSAYIDSYFPRTVYVDNCRSWYKNDAGRVIVLWPGSCLHAVHTLSHPRWGDFDYEPLDKELNRFSWLGAGWTWNEKTMTGDRAWYLNEVDHPPVPTK